MLDLLRPRERRALGVFALFGTLALGWWLAVGRHGDGGQPSSRAGVAELTRRREAGDPVEVDAREWPGAIPGDDWTELRSEPRFGGQLLLSTSALDAARAGRRAELVALHEADAPARPPLSLEAYDACALWGRRRGALERLLWRDERLRRDPARWAAAGPEERTYRAARAFLMSSGRRDASP